MKKQAKFTIYQNLLDDRTDWDMLCIELSSFNHSW